MRGRGEGDNKWTNQTAYHALASIRSTPLIGGRHLASMLRVPASGTLAPSWGLVTLLALAVAGFTACRPHAERLIPDRVDVVVSTGFTAESGSTATLQSGEVAFVDGSPSVEIVSHALAGGLLIRGSQPRSWFMGVPQARGCYYIAGWGTEDGSSIVLDSGPVLSEAPAFDRGSAPASQHRFEASGFCLDQQGRVTSVEF